MSYSLWTNGILLGHTTPMPADVTADRLCCFFHTSSAFDSAGEVLSQLADARNEMITGLADDLPSRAALAGLTEEERGLRVHEALRGNARVRRLFELEEAAAGLALELRDERGTTVPVKSLELHRIGIPEELVDGVAAAAAGFGVRFSELMLVATLPGTSGDGS